MNHSKVEQGISTEEQTQPNENSRCLNKVTSEEMTFKDKVKEQLKKNLILVLTILGIFGGIIVGFIGRMYNLNSNPDIVMLLGFPGEILLRVLKMLILPLIISSLITGLAQLDPRSSGKMGSRAIAFYLTTTFIACLTGVFMAMIVRPGRQKLASSPLDKINREPISTFDAMLDIVRNMFPENVVQACSQQIGTSYKRVIKPRLNETLTQLNNGTKIFDQVEVLVREIKYIDGTNVMGLVVFCTIIGIFISHAKNEAQILYDFFFVMNELIMKIVALIMWYSPVGILFLVATNIVKIDNMAETAKRLSLYMVTVILGLLIHALFTIQMLYFLTTRKNPLVFLKGMLQAWLTAVGTASSSATLPITFRCLEENLKVDRRVTRFMLPLGATVNMDGTALYQCVATIFIAQLNGIEFSFGQMITVCFASTATSIGVASVPSAALVTMLIVLSTVGLPTEHVSFIIAVDWLLDRLRTSVNVLGDAYGCGIVAHLSRLELKKLDDDAETEFAKLVASGGTGNVIGYPRQQTMSVHDETVRRSSQMSQQLSSHNNNNNNNNNLSQSNVNNNQNSPQISKSVPAKTIDSIKKKSRNILFGTNKLPVSVISMPQIAITSPSDSITSNTIINKQDTNI